MWQKAIDGWLLLQNDPLYKVPKDYCGEGNGIHLSINPGNQSRVDGEEVTLKANVVSDKTVEWVDLYLDGNKEERFTNQPYQKSYKLASGNHKVRFVVHNSVNVEADQTIEFGVNQDFITPTPTPTPTP